MIKVKGTMKIWNKPLWKQLAISIVLAMVASGIVIGAGSVNNASNVSLSSATIYVPDDYAKIQWAVDAANLGDTIIVRDGTYTENVNVNKRLTIESENGSAKTIVQAANPSDHVFEVTADYVNISGFTVKGAWGEHPYYPAGIYLHGTYLYKKIEHCNICENIVSNTYHGINLHDSSNNSLTGNTALNTGFGIGMTRSSNNSLTNNTVSNTGHHGIYFYLSSNNILRGNTMSGSGINLDIYGHELSQFTHDIDTSNKVNGKSVQYLVDKEGLVIDSSWDVGYLGVVNCTRITVNDLTLNNNGQGVLLVYSNDSRIKNINASHNRWGIFLWHSSNNTLTNNSVLNNVDGISLSGCLGNTLNNNTARSNYRGIFLAGGSSENTLSDNTLSDNSYGICLSTFSNNSAIYSNNFINNTDNVESYSSTNIWNSPEKITYTYNGSTYTNYLGNYWDDYKEKYPDAEEIEGTGIWDTPYSIDSDQDNHPLKELWENYFAPAENIFDTGSPPNPYPSIMGNHTGTIKPNHTVIATKLYTYPCEGTGGHTEFARIWNSTWNATATWKGYVGDWHNITFDKTVVLLAGETYNYAIRTGSYPQIIHESPFNATGGEITCTKFTDANGKVYYDWIPAIKLWT